MEILTHVFQAAASTSHSETGTFVALFLAIGLVGFTIVFVQLKKSEET